MSEFSQLKSNVSKELGLDETANGNDDILLGRRLNQAVREVLVKTECYVIADTITLTLDDNEYELGEALTTPPLSVSSIVNADNDPLDRVSIHEIHDLRRGSAVTGSNVYRYALNGANLLMLYPNPPAGALTVYYVPLPTEMSNSAHDPSDTTYGGIPVQFHDLIELHASWRMAMRLRHQESQFGMMYKQLFDQGIFEARKSIHRLGGSRLGPVRRGRRLAVRRDPSQT